MATRFPARLKSGPMRTERLPNGRRRLLRDLVVEVRGLPITVKENTETDFSTLRWPGRFLVHWSRVDIAGVVHDWLYLTGTVDRATADRVWRDVARSGQHRANAFQAWVGWAALRLFGWIAWRRHRSATIST